MKRKANKSNSLKQSLRSIENKIDRIEKEERAIEKEEKAIENSVISLGAVNVRKKHFFEILRASAGAFLGVGLGRSFLGLDNVAKGLPWINAIGILAFVLILSALLIYKNEKTLSNQVKASTILRRLTFIYAISIVIELLSIFLFNVSYENVFVLIKIMIVGSYAAMASAVTFSLDK
ncbi:MAG TPA: hypothetical protein VHA12_04435 [Candidatus Nanoarchaeia archaeon]|nr:hypothetical protein [Candidatus Nanoarchaeia archaeon]